ncbi:T9SS C-terminal target domain-containing protein [Hymenobacter lapidiphilus]|uniref:T9SS type A sorting domain-containing protein n=1 Tax=Hymenobacter sp. CCM 8763 TaxID=2303334 RepID=UPI000E3481ED|nr:T9SS type A sorting domain-containing protein [Hymenobacter sp. CCM 8763]RFP65649.1 T9SS C-terminal target domain-containing protein [Hymenobacter sp. CCM 8763]
MKKVFTLAALGLLTAASFSAQAQAPITVDGQITATEAVASGYQLVGRRLGASPATRGFGDAGLLSVYAAADANNLYFFVAGTLQVNADVLQNSIQMFIDRPGVDGVPIGTALPLPAAATAPAVNTSFEKMGAKLDLAADIAIAVSRNDVAGQAKVDGVVYTPTTATAVVATSLPGGAPLNITTGAAYNTPATLAAPFGGFANASVAYRTSANLSSNPGYNGGAAASIGNAPANGFEIRVSRTAMGIPTAGGQLRIFVVQNNQDGGFLSSDFIPQGGFVSSTTNAGANPDFTSAAFPGTQAATLNVTATGLTVITSTKSAAIANALKFNVFPNPAAGAATVSYTVPGQQEVSVEVFNALGQRVRSLASGRQGGLQQQNLSDLASGAYFVKLQVGGQSTSQKLIVQ